MTATETTPARRPAPFRPRTRAELDALAEALQGLALSAVAEIESITTGYYDADAAEILAATTELRAVSELLEDLRTHAAASRSRGPAKKKKAKKKAATV